MSTQIEASHWEEGNLMHLLWVFTSEYVYLMYQIRVFTSESLYLMGLKGVFFCVVASSALSNW